LKRVGPLAGAAALILVACAEPALPPPQASLDNIQTLRAADIAPVKIGAFSPAPGSPAMMDKSIIVRAGTQAAPEGSYAAYLADTLAAELKGAGRLDPNSSLVLSGMITDTHADAAMPMASARLAARFTLSRSGQTVFDKTLSVEAEWNSDFVGAVAIPDAFNHYSGLFPQLATKLFADPEFKAAAKPS
jgi:hypothetical protein